MNILFVDDDPMVLNGIKRSLFRTAWHITCTDSGEGALRVLKDKKIDVVVSDMQMPQMDGPELMARIQQHHPEIVRIILSGYADQDKCIYANSVVHRWLDKPCSTEHLIETLQQIDVIRP